MEIRILALSMFLAASCATADYAAEQSSHDVIYSSSDRAFIMALIDSQFYMGEIAPVNSFDEIPLRMGSEGQLEDKSTQSVRCVTGGAPITFAVAPDIAVGMRFECNGNQFEVESCEPQSDCAIYVISAVCPRYANGHCVPSIDNLEGVFRYRYRWSPTEGITHVEFDRNSGNVSVSLKLGTGLLSLDGLR